MKDTRHFCGYLSKADRRRPCAVWLNAESGGEITVIFTPYLALQRVAASAEVWGMARSERMDQSRLRSQLQDIEHAAQRVLARDASFLEALQALKRLVDTDARVRAALRALQDRGLSVSSSFVPRVRVWLHAGEPVPALPSDSIRTNLRVDRGRDRPDPVPGDSRTQELRDTASSVIAASLYCRQLQRIVNEALQASDAFERLASDVERSGYELQICLDLSTYAQVREKEPAAAPGQVSRTGMKEPMPANSVQTSRLPLSRLDVDFLKELRIKPD